MRYKSLLIFVVLAVGCQRHTAIEQPTASQQEKNYTQLRVLSGRSLNIRIPQLKDSIIDLCRTVENQAHKSKNIIREFEAGQIAVNTYGQAGEFGLAINKAQALLEKARHANNPLATGLAIQAMGDNYLHTNRFKQADSVFSEAVTYIVQNGDEFMRLHLLLQRLHVYLILQDSDRTKRAIERAHTLLNSSDSIPDKATYDFLLKYYQTTYALQQNDMVQAERLLADLQLTRPSNGFFYQWVFFIATKYYDATKDYDTALHYSNLALQAAQQGNDGIMLRYILQSRADQLARIGEVREACELHRRIARMSDSLFKTNYVSQIDSLHDIYWTDQLQISFINSRNELYTRLIGKLVGIALITVVIVFFIRRQNRRLRTSRIELEALREASNNSTRTKSLFLSNMSHELRTPLNAITGFSTLLTDNDDDIDDQTRQQCTTYIRQNADLLQKLINDVVDFSELQEASIPFTFEQCDVVALCHNVIKTVENVKRTAAQTRFETSLTQLEICTDKNRLQQVLINLLINATKFTKEGSITLRLTTDPGKDEAVFFVEDTGCGIPPEKQASIFERFEKLHENIQGAGLGLSICKLIVEHTGGQIWIDRKYTLGARFVFTHPLHFIPKGEQK